MPITLANYGIITPGSVLDPATLAWVAAVVGNGGTVSNARKTIVDTLIRGLKTDGLFTKLDRLWLFAAENEPSALTDIVADVLATAVNSPAFAADLGYTGVDSSSTVYIDTNTNLSTLGGQYSTNSAHQSAWSNTNAASSATGGTIVCAGTNNVASTNSDMLPNYNGNGAYFRINDSPASGANANADSTGHYIANRSDATHSQGYKNGALFASPNAAAGNLINLSAVVLASVDANSGHTFGGGYQITMASFGGSLSGTDVTNFYNRLRTYMTAVGVP